MMIKCSLLSSIIYKINRYSERPDLGRKIIQVSDLISSRKKKEQKESRRFSSTCFVWPDRPRIFPISRQGIQLGICRESVERERERGRDREGER